MIWSLGTAAGSWTPFVTTRHRLGRFGWCNNSLQVACDDDRQYWRVDAKHRLDTEGFRDYGVSHRQTR